MSNLTNKIIPAIVGFLFWIYQAIASKLLAIRFSSTPNKIPPSRNSILMESATSIANRIRSGKVTSSEVVVTFIDRIKEINDVLNCVVDHRFDEALEEARKVDALIASGSKTKEEIEAETPLLGVPFSTKDSIAVKGLLNTSGILARKDVRAEEDSEVVALLRKAGAIPLAITNVAELCFWWESYNPVHGRTNNPYDTNRTVGGSSGGEGALVTAAGSPLGIGSDMGGSIRIPAAFNGIFGHKPSGGITPIGGMHPKVGPEQSFLNTIGPMSRYSVDLLTTLKIITKNAKVDLKLNEPVDVTKLKYYYIDEFGSPFVTAVDSEIKNAIDKVVKHYKKSYDITVQRITISKLQESVQIWLAKMTDKSGPKLASELVNNEGKINIYKEFLKTTVGLSNHTACTLLMGICERWAPPYGSPEHKYYLEKSSELAKEFEELLGNNGVLLTPTMPTAALYHKETLVRPFNFAYTAIFNILGLPGTHCPMGLNKKGLPIGVQVVAGRNQDRLTIAVAKELEKAFNGGWVPPPTHGILTVKGQKLIQTK